MDINFTLYVIIISTVIVLKILSSNGQKIEDENDSVSVKDALKYLFVRIENDGSVREIDLQKNVQADESGPPLTKIPAKKIVGGKNSIKGTLPYQISIKQYGGTRCGGTIYNNKTILTAAHCFIENGPNGALILMRKETIDANIIVAGDHNSLVPEPEEQSSKIESVVFHPNYNPSSDFDDIAIIKLKTPLIFNKFVQPLPIGYPPIIPESVGAAIISGWGYTKARKRGGGYESAYFPNILKETQITVFSPKQCLNFYKFYYEVLAKLVRKGVICAGVPDGSSDACQGDSGGPLACIDPVTKKRFLCGIVSTGLGCGVKGVPGVYTRVAAYQKWIIETSGYAEPRENINQRLMRYKNTNVQHYPEI